MVPLIDLSRRLLANSESFHAVVQEVLTSGNVLLAQQTEMFEKSFSTFAGTKYGVAVSSGASALQLSLAALGIGEGDEVIVPAMTAVPTASAVCAVGARPVIVDIDDETAAIDFDQVESAMTERTRAVIVVHLYGRPVANIERLMNLGVKVVEDCAQSHGATRGLTGTVGAYSFYPTKNLGGIGDGGMIVTDDIEIAEVLNEMMKRACDFEKPKVTMTSSTATTTATTTAYRKPMVEVKAKDEVEAFKTEEADRVLVEPVVVVEAAYPNLVSNNKMNSLKMTRTV